MLEWPAAYSASKAAVIGLAKATAKEYAETGITVNSLAPAVVKMAMVAAIDPSRVKYMADKIPTKRSAWHVPLIWVEETAP